MSYKKIQSSHSEKEREKKTLYVSVFVLSDQKILKRRVWLLGWLKMPCRKTATVPWGICGVGADSNTWPLCEKFIWILFKTQRIFKVAPCFWKIALARPCTESQASHSLFWRRRPQLPSSLCESTVSLCVVHCTQATGRMSVNKVAIWS